jgi:hypothetical protein
MFFSGIHPPFSVIHGKSITLCPGRKYFYDKFRPMESILHFFGNINLMPFFNSLLTSSTEPFVKGFHSLVAAFEPYYNALFSSDPSIIAGILVVLLSYSIFSALRRFNKTRAFVTIKKPSSVISEGFPGRM